MNKVFNILLINFIISSSTVLAQVGFGTTNPNNSSIVDMQSTNRGLLIPRMTTLQREAINNPANGLLVFDTDERIVFFYDQFHPSTTPQWQPLNPYPLGGIIMWSGDPTNLPIGWVLCDGNVANAGIPINGITIPDLRGRFIVGYNATDVDYDVIGELGGEKEHTLTIAEMPAHNHSYTRRTGDAEVNDGISTSKTDVANDVDSNPNTDFTGGGQPHENRPPYYTLAYIIRVR